MTSFAAAMLASFTYCVRGICAVALLPVKKRRKRIANAVQAASPMKIGGADGSYGWNQARSPIRGFCALLLVFGSFDSSVVPVAFVVVAVAAAVAGGRGGLVVLAEAPENSFRRWFSKSMRSK